MLTCYIKHHYIILYSPFLKKSFVYISWRSTSSNTTIAGGAPRSHRVTSFVRPSPSGSLEGGAFDVGKHVVLWEFDWEDMEFMFLYVFGCMKTNGAKFGIMAPMGRPDDLVTCSHVFTERIVRE